MTGCANRRLQARPGERRDFNAEPTGPACLSRIVRSMSLCAARPICRRYLLWAVVAAVLLLGTFGLRWYRFEQRWGGLRRGQTVGEVEALVGSPDDDRMRANILGAEPSKVVWEYARGAYIYEAYLDRDSHEHPTVLYSVERRLREGREWISLRARKQ